MVTSVPADLHPCYCPLPFTCTGMHSLLLQCQLLEQDLIQVEGPTHALKVLTLGEDTCLMHE